MSDEITDMTLATQRVTGAGTERVSLLGADRKALTNLLKTRPAAVLAALDDVLRQTGPDELADIQTQLREASSQDGGLVDQILSRLRGAVGLDALVGDLAGQWGLEGIIGPLGGGTGPSGDALPEANDFLTWLEFLLQPYNRTGRVDVVDIYAPILDVWCAPNAAGQIQSSASYVETSKTEGGIAFECPGIAMDGSFSRQVTGEVPFDAVGGSHQIVLPVRMEVHEWLNEARQRRKYTARAVDVGRPTQFDELSEHYVRPEIAYEKPFIEGGLKALRILLKLDESVTASAKVGFDVGEEGKLTLSYNAAFTTALSLSVTGGKREYEVAEGDGAPMFLSIARP